MRRLILCILPAFFISIISVAQSDSLKTIYLDSTGNANDENTFTKVEVEASIDWNEWRSHLEKALVPVINKAVRKKAPAGKYTVNVKFIVERDGSISSVTALNDPGYGMAEGAAKVVKGSPKWTPG